MAEDVQDPLYSLLKEVQLEHFYHAIKSIDVTKVEHFENVVFEDLTNPNVGMGAPAARRLLEAAKKRNHKWRKNLFNIILPKSKEKDEKTVNGKTYNEMDSDTVEDNSTLTCLIPNKDIKLLDKIGDGSFGVVMRAQWIQPNKAQKYVAVKVLKQEVILRALEDFAKEVNAMHQLKHPNLIKLYGIVLSSPMMMVTELAEQGSLRSKLIKTLGAIPISTLVDYSFQIANGMEYLENKRLIHRDLATRNIFITGTNAIKIGDFGLMRAVPFDEDYYTMSDNMKVPFPWCAIESLKYRQFSHASDTWMYGVTLWEIFSFGQEPWAGLNGSQIIKKLDQNERLTIPKASPNQVYKVMSLCWNREPKERPTFAALMKFFKNLSPIKLKALTNFYNDSPKLSTKFQNSIPKNDKYLKISLGDEIEVIEGKPENYWWKGQNLKTFDIGIFPRSVAKDLRSLNSNDISKPLKNSFIHTGHMDPLGKNSWGNPEFIEKMYLEHPIEPPDVLGIETESNVTLQLETRDRKNVFINDSNNEVDKISSIEDIVNNKFEQDNTTTNDTKEGILIDFNDEIKVNSNSTESVFSLQNDLTGINFEVNNDLLDTENTCIVSEEETKENKEEMNVVEKLCMSLNEFQLQSSSLQSANKPNLSSLYSKYYAPPLDNYDTQFNKSRYYSSVCSNCDFTNEFSCNSFSVSENVCKCCGEYDYNNPCTNQYMPNSNYIPNMTDTCLAATCNSQATSYPQTQIINSNPTSKPIFETKICKDFIEELEANFSKITHVKLPENVKKDSVVYPVINPPPKTYKTRRPAPPPPVQKKPN